MKSKKILTLIFAVLLVFSLFGCGKKEPVADIEPQDTVEQEKLTPVVTEEEEILSVPTGARTLIRMSPALANLVGADVYTLGTGKRVPKSVQPW